MCFSYIELAKAGRQQAKVSLTPGCPAVCREPSDDVKNPGTAKACTESERKSNTDLQNRTWSRKNEESQWR